MIYAHIIDGLVANVIVWDGETEYGVNDGRLKLIDNPEVGIGWRRENGEWIAPLVEEPE